jgi:hypothetical protein
MTDLSELRRRSTSSTATNYNDAPENDDDDDCNELLLPGSAKSSLSANAMITASPSHQGVVYKLHVPLLFTLLPTFLQRLVCRYLFFLAWLTPQWRERYLIQIGSYLYKFKTPSSKSPKGSPLALESIETQMVSIASRSASLAGVEFAMEQHHLPSGYSAVFQVSTLRKRHYYAVSSREEALAWIHSLSQGRQETMTRNLGHAANVPYPKSWQYFDTLGKSHLQSKDRIRKKLEESSVRDMDLSRIGSGGPAPSGYFG